MTFIEQMISCAASEMDCADNTNWTINTFQSPKTAGAIPLIHSTRNQLFEELHLVIILAASEIDRSDKCN